MLYTYYYEGSQLQRLTVGDSLTMNFIYDANGLPYAIIYNGVPCYYVLNQQGDVVQIVGAAGKPYGTYTYDAWGNILSQTNNAIINANPLRYRGYVYDTESKLYYCQSRYYDPATGRFLNADALASTAQGLLGNNMFAYCNNNPVNHIDPHGDIPIPVVIILNVLIEAAASNLANIVYYEFSDGESDLDSDSYRDETLSRWEKLDYTKQQTDEEHFNINAWRYYNEYSLHEYGWRLTGWSYGKDIPLASRVAQSSSDADVSNSQWDDRWEVNAVTVILGLLGL